MVLKLGLILNPVAGIGGPAGLKGSDSEKIQKKAIARGAVSQVAERVLITLSALLPVKDSITITTVRGKMGEQVCKAAGLVMRVLDIEIPARTTAAHTRQAVRAMQREDIDLLLFAGGDGTARDIVDSIEGDQVVLGIPAGVKMHSGVFANNPLNAAKVILQMARAELVSVSRGEVRDIDEATFREGIVSTRYYGELWIPDELRYIQQVKSGGREVEALVVEEIAASVTEQLEPDINYFVGSGSTTAAIMRHLKLPGTLLGVDVVCNSGLLLADAHEGQLYQLAKQGACKIIITVIGGQGHILGRGNQQFSPRVVRAVGLDNIIVVASKSKLEAIGSCLRVDSGDPALDQSISGFIRIITGYEDAVLCTVLN